MGTTPHVSVPDSARDATGVISMGPVIRALAPEIAALRDEYFVLLAELIAREPAVHELNRIATAELTGCRYCRNIRRQDAKDAGVDEDAVERVRAAGAQGFDDPRTRAALELGERVRGYPIGAETPGPAPEHAALFAQDPALADAVVLAVARAVADGKAIVALGLEPDGMPVRVI
jgi:AhpD family alkylhydroperoxidase